MTRILEVAAGVVIREDGQVLLAQRAPGKAYEGWWEFPGGKIEAGETPAQGLARELEEELGLRIEASHPWLVREHIYPHAHVRLHFRRVFGAWGDDRGEPRSNEGQAFGWHPIMGAPAQPLLPASVAVYQALRLPAVLPTWEPSPLDAPPIDSSLPMASTLRAAEARLLAKAGLAGLLAASIPLLVARFPRALGSRVASSAHAASSEQVASSAQLARWQSQARHLASQLRALGGFLLVPSSFDEELARFTDALLLDPAALARATRRPPVAMCAARCEQAQDIARAQALELDFVLLAPGLAAVLPDGQAAGLPSYPCPRDPELRPAVVSGAHGVLLASSSSSSIEPGIT